MTTREAIYKSTLEHIRDGSDAVCTECGWTGKYGIFWSEHKCPTCGKVKIQDFRCIAAYALAQGEKEE